MSTRHLMAGARQEPEAFHRVRGIDGHRSGSRLPEWRLTGRRLPTPLWPPTAALARRLLRDAACCEGNQDGWRGARGWGTSLQLKWDERGMIRRSGIQGRCRAPPWLSGPEGLRHAPTPGHTASADPLGSAVTGKKATRLRPGLLWRNIEMLAELQSGVGGMARLPLTRALMRPGGTTMSLGRCAVTLQCFEPYQAGPSDLSVALPRTGTGRRPPQPGTSAQSSLLNRDALYRSRKERVYFGSGDADRVICQRRQVVRWVRFD